MKRGWRTAATRAGLALVASGLGGCVQLGFSQVSIDEPIDEVRLQALRPGQQSLGECLAALGAPNRVFEYRGDGMALLWVWRDISGWGLEVSSPSDNVPGSFEFDQQNADLPGCVLWFGADLVLERWRAGAIGDLLPGRVRPSLAAEGSRNG